MEIKLLHWHTYTFLTQLARLAIWRSKLPLTYLAPVLSQPKKIKCCVEWTQDYPSGFSPSCATQSQSEKLWAPQARWEGRHTAVIRMRHCGDTETWRGRHERHRVKALYLAKYNTKESLITSLVMSTNLISSATVLCDCGIHPYAR